MRCIQLLGCLAIALLVSMRAEAGGSYGSYGSYGGYASSGGSYGVAYGSSGGSYGSSGGGVFAGLRAHLAAKHAGSSGGYASSGGSSGGYVAAYASSGGSSGGSHGSSGGGLFSRLRAHIAAKHARHASSGGYVVAHSGGSSGGSSGGYYAAPAVTYRAPSYGSSGGVSYAAPSYGSSGGASYAAPAIYAPPVMSSGYPVESSIHVESSSIMGDSVIDGTIIDSGASYETRKPTLDDDAALLTVAVPLETAKVTVNGHETKSDGMVRQFMSRGLKDGYLYTYEVVVMYEVDGEEKVDRKTIKLRPGDMERLVFIQGEEAAEGDAEDTEEARVNEADETQLSGTTEAVETVVKLIVPTDAQVTLAGNPTNGNGDVRIFRTTQLSAGQSWENYTVEVSVLQGERRLSQQRTVNVAAGSTVELAFDFDAMTVAMR